MFQTDYDKIELKNQLPSPKNVTKITSQDFPFWARSIQNFCLRQWTLVWLSTSTNLQTRFYLFNKTVDQVYANLTSYIKHNGVVVSCNGLHTFAYIL